jgi:hypothetical protein
MRLKAEVGKRKKGTDGDHRTDPRLRLEGQQQGQKQKIKSKRSKATTETARTQNGHRTETAIINQFSLT